MLQEDSGHFVLYSLLFLSNTLSPVFVVALPIITYTFFRFSSYTRALLAVCSLAITNT